MINILCSGCKSTITENSIKEPELKTARANKIVFTHGNDMAFPYNINFEIELCNGCSKKLIDFMKEVLCVKGMQKG